MSMIAAGTAGAPGSLAHPSPVPPAATPPSPAVHWGLQIDVEELGRVLPSGRRLLDGITLSVTPGQMVAIIGSSGAGKSTLLDTIAGVRRPSTGTVHFDGADAVAHREAFRHSVAYVPQDDIIHRDLPVSATLRYAARLRLPHGTPPEDLEERVSAVLASLELEDRAGTIVGSLSGGQRKRASIGVELLTRPRAIFLDEPTSGLDPLTARGLMRTLRRLADDGTTVLLTTHNTDDLHECDRLVLLTDGRLVFDGSPAEARRHFGVDDLAGIYERAASATLPAWTPAGRNEHRTTPRTHEPPHVASRAPAVGWWGQGRVLARRNLDVLRHNRLTLAIMLGSPALVVSMFAVLFEPHAFDPARPSASAAVSITYWMAFAAFFFGLTYGLLQIVTEAAVLRRERFVGLRIGPYLAAKAAILVPVLAAVNVAMVAVLWSTDRLPAGGVGMYASLLATLMLDAVAALALGLLASAAVADPAQATLALPMLCFPAVLFSGAVLPVPTMALPGRLISAITSDRWAFEATGRALHLDGLLAHDPSGRGLELLAEQKGAFAAQQPGHWVLLVAFAVAFLVGAARVIRSRTASA